MMRQCFILAVAATLAALFAATQVSPAVIAGLIFFNLHAHAAGCLAAAHVMIFLAVMLKAWVVWLNAEHERHTGKLKFVAIVFMVASLLGIASVMTMELVPMTAGEVATA